jgi:hypothetical protein
MLQSGHGAGRDVAVWDMITQDRERQPPKPTLDGEPNYEDHPVSPWPTWNPANGYFRDHDVRKQVYRSVFAGGCGVTYGHHAVWQFYTPGREPVNHVDRSWIDALDRPGAAQMRHLRALIESRPMLARVPDQSLLISPEGSGGDHTRATRADNGSYAFVYSPSGGPVTLDLATLSGTMLKAWWYDPRTGTAHVLDVLPKDRQRTFTPPSSGQDWVLVLDDAGHDFPAPGQRASHAAEY